MLFALTYLQFIFINLHFQIFYFILIHFLCKLSCHLLGLAVDFFSDLVGQEDLVDAGFSLLDRLTNFGVLLDAFAYWNVEYHGWI